MSVRRELTVTIQVTSEVWGDDLDEIAAGFEAEYLHPGSVVTDLILAGYLHDGESFTATLTEYDDRTGDVRTAALWADPDLVAAVEETTDGP